MLVAAAATTWWFYPKAKGKSFGDKFLFYTKRALRFVSLFLLLFLLLSPVLKYLSQKTEKPILGFYLDDSKSVKLEDSSAMFSFYEAWEKFASKLSDEFDVRRFYFSNQVLDSFSGFEGSKTRLNAPSEHAKAIFKRQNLGALIIASDGIMNTGNNPIYEKLTADVALFTVGLGDTTQRKDVFVKEVNANSLVFLNNSFNVLAHIQGYGFEGQTVKVSLMEGARELSSQNHTFRNSNDYSVLEFVTDADKPGFKRYSVKISSLEGELTRSNNQKDFYVEVIDGREKVLLLYHSPHPDVNAIANALSVNKNYEVVVRSIQDFEESELKDISLLIGHQFPTNSSKDTRIMLSVRKKKIPFWVILGGQSPVDQLGAVLPEIRIVRRGNSWNDAQLNLNSKFNAFSFSEELIEQSTEWPPLLAPFGQYNANSKLEVLGFQSINRITTEFPLIAFSETEGIKTGWIFGEGVWRWRIKDFSRNNSDDIFNELISKTARYLMVKEDKRRFRAYPAKNEFDEDENIRLQAELFDQNFEPIANAEISLKIVNESGKEFDYLMSQSGSGYALDAGNFEAGYYSFVASVKSRPEFEKVKGGFLVKPVQIEYTQLQADHSLLKELAANTEGAFFNQNQFEALEKAIREDSRIRPLIKTNTKIEELIKVELLLMILAACLAFEWFIRKWEGGY